MIPVVRIKSTHKESQGDFVEINESDFDPKKHELYVPEGESVDDSKKSVGDDADKNAGKNAGKKAVDPFSELVGDWKQFRSDKLIRIAAAISGRTAADKAEATAMIETALVAKANAEAAEAAEKAAQANNAGGPVPPPPPPV